MMSAALLVIGIGIGAFGNSSRWTRAVSVTFGRQHLSLERHIVALTAKPPVNYSATSLKRVSQNHTDTHNHFTALFSRTTRVSRCQKKTSSGLL